MPLTTHSISEKPLTAERGSYHSSGKLNHFALKAKIYIRALHTAFAELQKLQPLKITA
jgi:hypothetical protein